MNGKGLAQVSNAEYKVTCLAKTYYAERHICCVILGFARSCPIDGYFQVVTHKVSRRIVSHLPSRTLARS